MGRQRPKVILGGWTSPRKAAGTARAVENRNGSQWWASRFRCEGGLLQIVTSISGVEMLQFRVSTARSEYLHRMCEPGIMYEWLKVPVAVSRTVCRVVLEQVRVVHVKFLTGRGSLGAATSHEEPRQGDDN